MKQFGYVWISAIVLLCGCAKDMENNETGQKRQETIGVNIYDDTKASLDNVTTKWASGDELALFRSTGDNDHEAYTLSSGSGTTSGEFTGNKFDRGSASYYVAFHPNRVALTSTGSCKSFGYYSSWFWCPVDNEQAYCENGIDPKDLTMLGISEDKTNMTMKPAIAVLRFAVRATVDFEISEILVEGSKVSGTWAFPRNNSMKADFDNNTIANAQRLYVTKDFIEYSFPTPIQLNKSEYTQINIALLPGNRDVSITLVSEKDVLAYNLTITNKSFACGRIRDFGNVTIQNPIPYGVLVTPDNGTETKLSEVVSFNHKIKVRSLNGARISQSKLTDLISKANVSEVCNPPYMELDLSETVYERTGMWPRYKETFGQTYVKYLSKMSLPGNITSIGDHSFCPSNLISSFTLPEGLRTIEPICLYDITENAGWKSTPLPGCTINIPSTVTSVGNALTNVVKFDVSSENTTYMEGPGGALYEYALVGDVKTPTKLIAYPGKTPATEFTIPDSVTSIEIYAFDNSHNLNKIVFGSGISSTGVHQVRNSVNVATVVFKSTDITSKIYYDKAFGTKVLSGKKIYVPESKYVEYRDNGYFADWIAAGWTLTYEGYTPSSASSNAGITPVESNNQNL